MMEYGLLKYLIAEKGGRSNLGFLFVRSEAIIHAVYNLNKIVINSQSINSEDLKASVHPIKCAIVFF